MPAIGARSASTSQWIAATRAKESTWPDRLFHDPFAAALAGEAGFEILARSEASLRAARTPSSRLGRAISMTCF